MGKTKIQSRFFCNAAVSEEMRILRFDFCWVSIFLKVAQKLQKWSNWSDFWTVTSFLCLLYAVSIKIWMGNIKPLFSSIIHVFGSRVQKPRVGSGPKFLERVIYEWNPKRLNISFMLAHFLTIHIISDKLSIFPPIFGISAKMSMHVFNVFSKGISIFL